MIPEEELEQRELARRQVDLDVAAPHTLRGRIERQVARGEHRRTLGRAAPDQRAQPGDENGVRERLGQVVIGAGVERFDFVPLAFLGGEHEDRRPHAFFAQRRTDAVAVQARQHDVEHDRVVGVLARHPEPVGTVERDVDREALGFEPGSQPGREPLLVLDDQHSHGGQVPERSASTGSSPAARRAGYVPESSPITAPSSGAPSGTHGSSTGSRCCSPRRPR